MQILLHYTGIEGSLRGLTRVRCFEQDDKHIFCTREQIKSEIKRCINFLEHVYKIFNFDFSRDPIIV